MSKHRSFLGAIAVAALLVLSTAHAALSNSSGATTSSTARRRPRGDRRVRQGPDADQRHAHDPEQRPEPQLHPADSRQLRQQPPLPVDLRVPLERRHRQRRRLAAGPAGTPGPTTGMRQQSNNSAIFVAPQGIGNGWANSGGQDVTFVDDMIRLIEADLCVDTTQLFAMGFSYGGGMSYALACARATVFRAVAVYSGGAAQRMQRRHPAHRVHGHPRHRRHRAQHLRRAVAARHVRPEQRLHPPEPARAGAGQPDAHRHHLLGLPGRVPGACGPRSTAATRPARWTGSGGDERRQDLDQGEVWRFFTQFGSTHADADPDRRPPTATPAAGRQRHDRAAGLRPVPGRQRRLADQRHAGAASGTATARPTSSGPRPRAGELRVYGNKCLDANGAGTANGTAVIIWDCNGQTNQQWSLNANGTHHRRRRGLCLDVPTAPRANGTKLVIWSCNGGANQRWTRS